MAKLIPRSVLFGNPEKVSPALSPDGTRVAFLAPRDGVLNIWVADIGGEAKPVTNERNRPVTMYSWTKDGGHLVVLKDENGDENHHLFLVDVATGDTRDMTPFPGVQATLLAAERAHPDELIVGLNRRDPALHDAYRLRIDTGELELIAENPGFGAFGGMWLIDRDHRVRGAFQARPDGGFDVLMGDGDVSGFEVVLSVPAEDGLSTRSMGFSGDGKSLHLITSVGANAARLVAFDTVTREMSVVVEDPAYDVFTFLRSPRTYDIQLAWVNRARLDLVVVDPALQPDIDALRTVDEGDLTVMAVDDAERRWLVAFGKDDAPTSYYIYDRPTKQAHLLFVDRPELEAYELASTEPFSFVARDGLTIHGYVTAPVGVPRHGLPTVLKVHGGPWSRDMWGLIPQAQWLANRGYLCVQIDFRGSTGYGKDFTEAGNREWAGKMHDDLVDGVAFVVDKGWADPERIAIFGASYGGYAALVGATFTPDLFRCAIDIVGPSNLITLLESIPPYWEAMRNVWNTRVGHPVEDRDELWARSPLSRVDAIKIPILIAQGANDPRVKQQESEQIVAAMKERGIEHEYAVFPDEGHGFAKPENSMRFHAMAERFLATHLGGRYEPESSTNGGSTNQGEPT